MAAQANEIIAVTIEDELKQSYLDYAMSVIVGRALPDVRDGLKPVHRRILYAMHELGNDWNKAYKKSARIVGDVVGKYHPHGEGAIYDSIVRMAQTFSMRYVLIDGQGNFGSVDGDPPAAMRYTEIRMARITQYLLKDIDKETVNFYPNYDETETQPEVLPAFIPNLLINGSSGIAVGMATNIPPHNVGEVINACLALLQNPSLDIDGLMEHIPGPDFPTAAIINGHLGIKEAYRTGKGRIHIRARTEVELDEKNNKQSIIVTELPYQVNKAKLLEKIAELVKDKKIDGITGLRDESDKDGMRMVIELRRGEQADIVINNLYSHTPLQNVFGINMVALIDGQPKLMTLKDIIEAFIRHRKEVVSKRTRFELKKCRERAHILEGLGIALTNIDNIILMIKQAANPQEAKIALMANEWPIGMVALMLGEGDVNICRPEHLAQEFGIKGQSYALSPSQAQAILDLRLHRLTGLEQSKILEEFANLLQTIQKLLLILADSKQLIAVIKAELELIQAEFSDKRRTEIVELHQDLSLEDLITQEDMVVTLSHEGYVKAQPLSIYTAQRRGGKGKTATNVKDEDYIQKLIIACTHDTLLCFSSLGRVYWLKVHQLPLASRGARGRPIVNLLPLQENEVINTILSIKNFDQDQTIFMATAKGIVKKVALAEFSRPRVSGIIAINLDEMDVLVGVDCLHADSNIMLFSDAGKAIRFKEEDVRLTSRIARGVRGIRLGSNQRMIALVTLKAEGDLLLATQHGFGKRTPVTEYPLQGRGGQGVKAIQTSTRNGHLVGVTQVGAQDELMLITNRGVMVRTRVEEVSLVGRITKGVRLMRLAAGEHLVALQRVDELEQDLAAMDELDSPDDQA